jgi:hypothetical protein
MHHYKAPGESSPGDGDGDMVCLADGCVYWPAEHALFISLPDLCVTRIGVHTLHEQMQCVEACVHLARMEEGLTINRVTVRLLEVPVDAN